MSAILIMNLILLVWYAMLYSCMMKYQAMNLQLFWEGWGILDINFMLLINAGVCCPPPGGHYKRDRYSMTYAPLPRTPCTSVDVLQLPLVYRNTNS